MGRVLSWRPLTAPVPLYTFVKTNSFDLNPYVCDTPIGSQMTVRKKSMKMMRAEALKMSEKRFAGGRGPSDRVQVTGNERAGTHAASGW